MAYQVNPPHDRVILSRDERIAFARIRRDLERIDHPPALPVPSRRARVLSHLLWLPRLAPLAVVSGLALMLLALPSSVVLSSLGVCLACAGATVILVRTQRHLAARFRSHHRGR